MPTISNLKKEYIPGFENPLTSWTLNLDENPDEKPATSGKKSSKGAWTNVQFINSAGDGYGPHATTLGDIATKIPSKPSLKPSCDNCRARPNQEGKGYSVCASCKVSCYCSRECQTTHWKEHKRLCRSRVQRAKIDQDLKAQVGVLSGPFVSQVTLRKWYYDNIDIVDYTILQTLELYKGRAHDLWRTHAVVFWLNGPGKGRCDSSSQIEFDDAEAESFTTLAREDRLNLSPAYAQILGQGSRIIVIFILDKVYDLMLIESHDLPRDEEYAKMEKDDMWRMHIRMRKFASEMGQKDSGEESDEN